LLQLDLGNAAEYLAAQGFALAGKLTPLGGGVSNTVLLAETMHGRLVVKQALERLRVAEEWLSDPARTLREAAALRDVAAVLPAGAVPAIAFLDEANYIYAMEAAPAGAQDWKTLLLAGEIDPAVGGQIGHLLARQVEATRAATPWRDRYGDQRVFDELRLDPYYRFTAARYPDLASYFERAIDRCREQASSLVHGDWSPKNMLIAGGRPMLIDYEVVHYGDAAFDAAFVLNHLLLKSYHRPQWRSRYGEAAAAFWEAAAPAVSAEGVQLHLGCLLLARVDGKSPAEYLNYETKPILRAVARDILVAPPRHLLDLWIR
jgi:5-methylthioribose kinase